MKFGADLHLHSKYARATSKRMNVENLARWGEKKGVKVLGTGDFTHPRWCRELKKNLVPAEEGLFRTGKEERETRFLLSSEISCIYSKRGKVRKIHLLVLAPSFEAVAEINNYLSAVGNLEADGRPTLGMDAEKLTGIIFKACPDCFLVPAHVWTPWFSLFGSRSGFDSMEECFGKETERIRAWETGLSSDPSMNWRLEGFDRVTLISNSDAHSPEKIGREANIFETELSYPGIVEAIESGDPEKFLLTVEFFPQEGKYHFDGHRKCGVSFSPEKTESRGGICPVCGKEVTVGVLHRVEDLADREKGVKPKGRIPYKHLVPLREIIAEAEGVGVKTKTVEERYRRLLESFSNEFEILLSVSKKGLKKVVGPKIAEGVVRVREGRVDVQPGYDGVYGEIRIFGEEEKEKDFSGQKSLFEG